MSFDWKGFFFAIAVGAFFVVVGTGLHYVSVASGNSTPVAPSKTELSHIEWPSPEVSLASAFVPRRVIDSLAIADVIPAEGKLVVADLTGMKLMLYENGSPIAEYPILSKGRPGTPWETPSGFYDIRSKERTHFSTIGDVYMPYSMQFYGNYFIHGWAYYPDGTPVPASFSGGCIRLSTEDSEKIFAFADVGTKVFVYDHRDAADLAPLALGVTRPPDLTAESYLVADIDTGDVYLEKDAGIGRPIASITKLMTALVANELISFEKTIPVEHLAAVASTTPSAPDRFLLETLLYPLLLESDNKVADAIARYYGSSRFVEWMNATADALGMEATTFSDASGASAGNLSTTDDVFRLLRYLADKKSFILGITKLPEKVVTEESGITFHFRNVNDPVYREPFVGGKAGHTTAAEDTMAAVVSILRGPETHRIAVIVLQSNDRVADTLALSGWLRASTDEGARLAGAACVGCAGEMEYRKIEP